MTNTGRQMRVSMLLGALMCYPILGFGASVSSIESPVLRVEVRTSPYSYRVIERSTGQVLLSQSGTYFGGSHERATEVKGLHREANQLQGTLALSQGADGARVTFSFVTPEVVRVVLTPADEKSDEIAEEFHDQGEHYYGIWESPFGGNIDDRGADHDFRGIQHQVDENYSSARAPFYVTSRKYGVYAESVTEGHYSIAQQGKTRFSFRGNELKYDVIYGPSYADVLRRYNTLAGPAIMPPTWAFASIWWRDDNHDDLRDVSNAQDKVIDDADRLSKLHLPAGAIWLDRPFGTGERGWGNMDFDPSFPDPPKMIQDLDQRGIHLLLWIANRCSNRLFQEGSAKGYLFPAPWPAADLRRPEVYAWFKQELDEYVRLGVKGYKIDRGEEDEMPLSVENVNAILLPKLAAEGLAARNGNDFFEFSRNANDTARKYTAVWNGDTRPTFEGLAVSIKNGLRSGAINFPMWGSDTGGYLGNPDKELFARWLEFSAYSPMMEVLIGPKRTIWYDYDQELIDIAKTYVQTHHDLIPYTRSYMHEATRTGMPIMRPLTFVFPGDPSVCDTWDEYLYGGELLVAPVTKAGATSREVYLPGGRWMNYTDKRTVYAGGSNVASDAGLNAIPIFVREGAIIPRGDILRVNNHWDENWVPKLNIEVFPSKRSPSKFEYFTGTDARAITAVAKNGGLEIHFPDLGVSGTLQVYCGNAAGVTRNGAVLRQGVDYAYDAKMHRLTVPFKGATDLWIKGATSLFDGPAH